MVCSEGGWCNCAITVMVYVGVGVGGCLFAGFINDTVICSERYLIKWSEKRGLSSG